VLGQTGILSNKCFEKLRRFQGSKTDCRQPVKQTVHQVTETRGFSSICNQVLNLNIYMLPATMYLFIYSI
jgi:hypothetical protein